MRKALFRFQIGWAEQVTAELRFVVVLVDGQGRGNAIV